MTTQTARTGKGSRSLKGRPDLKRFPKPCEWCTTVFEGLPEQRYDTERCKRQAAYDRVKRRLERRQQASA